STSRGLVDGEGPAEEDLPSLGHRDLDELAGLGLIRDVRRHQRDGVIGAGAAVRQDFASGSDHRASSVATDRAGTASISTSTSCSDAGGSGSAAWYSCSGMGTDPPARSASIPWTAARMPCTVVIHGTPAAAAAVRM